MFKISYTVATLYILVLAMVFAPPATTFASTSNGTTPEVYPLVPTITERDHVLGSTTAAIKVITYLDYECQFCRLFYGTVKQIMSTSTPLVYNNVTWSYRHYPIPALHPQATRVAEAAECVASIGGEPAFWKFTDLVLSSNIKQTPTKKSTLAKYAEQSGVKKGAFNKCYGARKTKARVATDSASGAQYGVQGTPTTFVVTNGTSTRIDGAQPLDEVKRLLIEQLGLR